MNPNPQSRIPFFYPSSTFFGGVIRRLLVIGLSLLFSLGCLAARKTTHEYTAIVDNFDIRLIAPSFSSYVDVPLTPGQQLDLARGGGKIYPYHHIRFSRDIGRIDIINVRANFSFGVTEIRGDKAFADFKEFLEWWGKRPNNDPLNLEPCVAFGLKGMKSTLTIRTSEFMSYPEQNEDYFFLSKSGLILYVHFSVSKYVQKIPENEKRRIESLILEVKQGLTIKVL